MENIKNHPAPDQLESFDTYPPYYGHDLFFVFFFFFFFFFF